MFGATIISYLCFNTPEMYLKCLKYISNTQLPLQYSKLSIIIIHSE